MAENELTSVVRMDEVSILKVELLKKSLELNNAEEKNLLLLLQRTREEGNSLKKQIEDLFVKIRTSLGVPPGKNLHLVDRETGLCKVE